MLTVRQLTTPRLERSRQNHETYKMIYETFAEQIRKRNEIGATATRFQVPAIFPGRGIYDHAHAVRYVAEKLKRGGFEVAVLNESGLVEAEWAAGTMKHARNEISRPIAKKKVKSESLATKLARLRKSAR